MQVKKITLRDFRNIKEVSLSFSPDTNVLFGDNAQGKTNLLEAIYFASIGKSFRGQHIGEIIRFGQKEAFISLDFESNGREQNISFALCNNRIREIQKNRVKIRRTSEILGSFRAVLFCPEHLSLIKDGPAERRQFLDIAISAAEPLYLGSLQRYNRVLKQRNVLLKDAERDRALFDATGEIWAKQLCHEAAYIARSRKRYIKRAEEIVKQCFKDMTGSLEEPALAYIGFCKDPNESYEELQKTENFLFQKLSENKEREIAAGSTLWGIHKDDIEVSLNGHAARQFCSQGQQRSLALALKIAESEICADDCGEYPVLLLDDVLSELDGSRRKYLLEHIKNKQVIITTCEKEGILARSPVLVKDGTYETVK